MAAELSLAAANVLDVWRSDDRRHHRSEVEVIVAGRNLVEDLCQPRGRGDSLDVHHRTRPAHDDGLLDGSHPHVTVDSCREVRRQLDSFSLDRAKAGQGERDGVGARP